MLFCLFGFRFFHLGDAKKELIDPQPPPAQADGTERNRFHDPEVVGFPEELTNFLFWSGDFHERIEEREGKTEYSVSKEIHSDIHEDSMKKEVLNELFVSKEIDYELEDGIEEDESVFMESDSTNFVVHEDGKENVREVEGFGHGDGEKINEDETRCSVSMKNNSDVHHDNMKKEEEREIGELVLEIDGNETENSVFMENVSCANEKDEKIDENETERSVLKEDDSNFLYDYKKIDEIETESSVLYNSICEEEKEEKTEDSVFTENDTVTTTSKYEFLSENSISTFMEEPTTLRFRCLYI